MNKVFEELPNKAHYLKCSDRLFKIKVIEQKSFYYTFFVGLILGGSAIFNIHFNVLSLFSDLIVGKQIYNSIEIVISGFTQLFTALGLMIIASVGKSKYKLCNIFLLSVYISLIISCIIHFGQRSSDLFGIILGLGGVFFYVPTIQTRTDFKTISKLEGYPYFNNFDNKLEPDEKPENKSEIETITLEESTENYLEDAEEFAKKANEFNF